MARKKQDPRLIRERKAGRRRVKRTLSHMDKVVGSQPTLKEKRLAVARLRAQLDKLPKEWQPTEAERRKADKKNDKDDKEIRQEAKERRRTQQYRRIKLTNKEPYASGRGEDGFIKDHVVGRLYRTVQVWRREGQHTIEEFYFLRDQLCKYAAEYGYRAMVSGPLVKWLNKAGGAAYTFLLDKSYSYVKLSQLWRQKGTYRVALFFQQLDLGPLADFVWGVLKPKSLPLTVANLT